VCQTRHPRPKFRGVQTPDTLAVAAPMLYDIWPYELKIGTSVTPVLGNVRADFFLRLFVFERRLQYGTEQTDGRTDRQTCEAGNAAC